MDRRTDKASYRVACPQLKNDRSGVHTAAERGPGRAVYSHLRKLNLNISESQRVRLARLQKAHDVQDVEG